MTDCCDTFPGQYENQSTLARPTLHSSPRMVTNSSSVIAGGRRLMTTFSPCGGAFTRGAFGASLEDWPPVTPFVFLDSSCGVPMAVELRAQLFLSRCDGCDWVCIWSTEIRPTRWVVIRGVCVSESPFSWVVFGG
jgi:hypothetical protein